MLSIHHENLNPSLNLNLDGIDLTLNPMTKEESVEWHNQEAVKQAALTIWEDIIRRNQVNLVDEMQKDIDLINSLTLEEYLRTTEDDFKKYQITDEKAKKFLRKCSYAAYARFRKAA